MTHPHELQWSNTVAMAPEDFDRERAQATDAGGQLVSVAEETAGARHLLIDRALPAFDVVIAESVVVDADLATTYEATRSLDFLQVRTPLLTAAFWIRSLPERFGRQPAARPSRLVIAQGDPLPGWVLLGEVPDRELAFGAVGKFWQGRIEWRDVAASEFAAFAEPAYGKIACDFRVQPCGPGRTLLTYECRTATTSSEARRKFGRYWRLVRPFVGYIMRATVQTVRHDAERSAGTAQW